MGPLSRRRLLTEEEAGVYRRGRNSSHLNIPKSARPAEYRMATGMEVLFGYLHLKGEQARLRELFALAYPAPGGQTKMFASMRAIRRVPVR